MTKGIVLVYMVSNLVIQAQTQALSGRNYFFNKCLGSRPFMYLERMSVRDCRNACAESSTCLAVTYHNVLKLCELHDVVTSMSSCIGFIVFRKQDFPPDIANPCSGSCPITDCTRIPSIANAETFGNMLDIGASIKVKCLYEDSVSYIHCQSNGQWSQQPTCSPQVTYCGTPSTISNSDVSFNSTSVGSTAVYTCHPGYGPSPSNSLTSVACLGTLQWELITFSCMQLDCGVPPDVSNSQKTYSSTGTGSTATYTCDSGFTSSPSGVTMSISCLNTGVWDSVSFTCAQIDCGAPSDLLNAQKTYSTTTSGSTVTYTCESGYSSSPSGVITSVTCLNTGQWESLSFTCELIDCGAPPDVGDSQKSSSSTLQGSSVTYTCNSGYNPTPSGVTMSITCLNSGQWESIGFTCQAIDCGTPPVVSYAQETYISTLAGSTVTYTCNPSFELTPSGSYTTIVCQQNGAWESINFSCAVTVTIGDSCNSDADCEDISARCLYTGFSSQGSRCYCKYLYEFNSTQMVCTQVCSSYTSLEKFTDIYIRKHNVGDSGGATLTEDECLQLCEDNFAGSYSSVDHRHGYSSGTNCYCGSVTRQQILDGSPEFLYDDNEYNLFTRTCDNP